MAWTRTQVRRFRKFTNIAYKKRYLNRRKLLRALRGDAREAGRNAGGSCLFV